MNIVVIGNTGLIGLKLVNKLRERQEDQIVQINISGKRLAKLIKRAEGIFYQGLPHGLTATHPDQVNADLLEFSEVSSGSSQSSLNPRLDCS